MKVKVSPVRLEQANLLIALVDEEHFGPPGDEILKKLSLFYPELAGMLVCVVGNGFKAYAHFQTARFLALLQLEALDLVEIDLNKPPQKDEEPPF